MRQVIVAAFVSLDGIMQAPGGPDEDPTGGFAHGGWTAPYFDDVVGSATGDLFGGPFALLLGRRTYDIFAAHWPHVPTDAADSDFDALNSRIARTFNAATKYVATHRPDSLTWQNSESLGADIAGRVRALKRQDGPPLVVQGSSELIQILLAEDLVDQVRTLTYPVILGGGKRLFGPGIRPGALTLERSVASPSGVLIASYRRAGAVQTGSFTPETPSDAELERRRTLT